MFARDLAAQLGSLGWETEVVAVGGHRTPTGIDVPVLGRRRLSATAVARLGSRMRARAAVTVAHGSSALPACALASLGGGGFVYRNIGDPAYWLSTRRRRLRVRRYLSRARHVVALWTGAADLFVRELGVPSERISVIPNGIDVGRFPETSPQHRRRARAALGLPQSSGVVCHVGAFGAEKNIDAVMGAVRELPDVWLVLAGEGPEEGRLRELAGPFADRVVWLGAVDDVAHVLQAADVIALASSSEGMPGALIEAGLTGLPAVATDVGAVAEVVVDGRTGHLVPPDDVGALREGIVACLETAHPMGEAARLHCSESFDIRAVAVMWDGVLRRQL